MNQIVDYVLVVVVLLWGTYFLLKQKFSKRS